VSCLFYFALSRFFKGKVKSVFLVFFLFFLSALKKKTGVSFGSGFLQQPWSQNCEIYTDANGEWLNVMTTSDQWKQRAMMAGNLYCCLLRPQWSFVRLPLGPSDCIKRHNLMDLAIPGLLQSFNTFHVFSHLFV